jgi:alkylation response protein AidB-like acyl-CoA dehydrogenase
MDADDVELFARSVRGAVGADDVDAALADLGWVEALADEPEAAISVLFSLQGEAGARSSALHVVVGADALPFGPIWVRLGGEGRPIGGVDPALGLVEVEAVEGWTGDLRLGQIALGHELVGASRTMLALAREHALAREQFGQPIARFQAVRHRLAEALVAIETAEAMLEAAWLDGTPVTAAMAKSLAGRGARTVARHCQQVLAGIGFTTEHDLHRFVRRTLVLDQLLGSARSLTKALGDDLIATRTLPPLLPL